MVVANDSSLIKQVIFALEHDFTLSSNPNSRKGGMVGLAATSIALGRVSVRLGLGLGAVRVGLGLTVVKEGWSVWLLSLQGEWGGRAREG